MQKPDAADATRPHRQFRAASLGDRRLTMLQKRFVQEYVNDPKGNATQACLRAGYKPAGARVQGAVNLALPNIAQEIERVRANEAKSNAITTASLLAELDEARELALSLGQASAAVQATKERAIIAGLRVERSERMTRNVNDLSDDELVAIAQGQANMLELEPSEVAWSTQRPTVGHK
jgi:phage terminase small subunit